MRADTLTFMRRTVVVLVGLLVVALIAAGCGDDAAPDQAEPERSAPQVEQQEDAGQRDGETARSQQSDQAEPTQTAVEPEAQQSAREQSEQAQAAQVVEEQSQLEQETEGRTQQQVQQPLPQGPTKVVLGGGRPATLLLPQEADRAVARPLIVLLHGYSSFAEQADQYFQFSQWVDEGDFGLLLPDGTTDQIGNRFWNATPECCDIFGAEPDDVGYIKALIEEAGTYGAFDQVFAVGHSNGGFMAYRLACEEVAGLTAIVSLAGGAFADFEDCRVPSPLSVLQIHGTADRFVLYEGGRLPDHPDPDRQAVPGAKDSVLRWAERAGCDIEDARFPPQIDTDTAVEGAETSIVRFAEGCAEGTVMELWTIEGGGHVPLVWGTDFTPGILKWLLERYGIDALEQDSASTEVEERTIGGERSAQLLLPEDRGSGPLPLVVSLHGYGGDAEGHDWYFGLSDRIAEYGFALITPQGTTDSSGSPFWNATDGCCNFYGSDVDDSGWISSLVADAREIVDVSGVHVVGYSNGGFMSYRVACDGLEGLVAIAGVAGSSFGDPERCADALPVSVLQIHGTQDMQIPYGGTLEYEGGYPGALELVTRWAERAGCQVDSDVALPDIDLDVSIDGAETSVRRIRDGCSDGITIELWTIEGADHFPIFQEDWPDRLLKWLFNESRTK